MKSNYSFQRVSGNEQVERISKIFNSNENNKSNEHLIWQYNNNIGTSYTIIANDSNEDAAVYSVFQTNAIFFGEQKKICQSLDTLTDINHRGKGLFVKMATEVFNDCDNDNIAFIYGFPNDSSAPGFFKKLGWKQLGFPPFLIFLNNIMFPINRLLKTNLFIRNYFLFFSLLLLIKISDNKNNYELKSDNFIFNEEYDSLWRKFSTTLKVALDRNSSYMKWRYQLKPNKNYRILHAYASGELVGILIYVILEKHGGRVGYVMDVIYDPKDLNIGKLLLRKAAYAMSKENVDFILAWADRKIDQNKVYDFSGFINMPRKLQPIKLFFGYRPKSNSNISLDEADFYISYTDSDTV